MSSWSAFNYLKLDNGLLQESWQYELVWPVSIITSRIELGLQPGTNQEKIGT